MIAPNRPTRLPTPGIAGQTVPIAPTGPAGMADDRPQPDQHPHPTPSPQGKSPPLARRSIGPQPRHQHRSHQKNRPQRQQQHQNPHRPHRRTRRIEQSTAQPRDRSPPRSHPSSPPPPHQHRPQRQQQHQIPRPKIRIPQGKRINRLRQRPPRHPPGHPAHDRRGQTP